MIGDDFEMDKANSVMMRANDQVIEYRVPRKM